MTKWVPFSFACAALLVAFAAVWAVANDQGVEAGQQILVDASPNTATNVINTSHTITANVTDAGVGVPGVTVDFDITGPNAAASGSAVADASGVATFTYTGTGGVGQDTIDVCVFSLPITRAQLGEALVGLPLACDTVTKDWVQPTATATVSPAPSATRTGSATPTATQTASAAAVTPGSLPATGDGNDGSSAPWLAAGILALFAVLGTVGLFALRTRLR